MKCTHIITRIVIYWLCYAVSLMCVTCFFANYRFSYHRLLLEILKGKQPRSSQELPCLVHRFYLRKKMKKLNQQLGGLFPLVCRAGLCWQVLSISDGKKDFFEIKIYLLLNWKVPSLRERCYAMQLFRELVSKGLYEITCLKLCQSATLQDKLPKSSSCKCRIEVSHCYNRVLCFRFWRNDFYFQQVFLWVWELKARQVVRKVSHPGKWHPSSDLSRNMKTPVLVSVTASKYDYIMHW